MQIQILKKKTKQKAESVTRLTQNKEQGQEMGGYNLNTLQSLSARRSPFMSMLIALKTSTGDSNKYSLP